MKPVVVVVSTGKLDPEAIVKNLLRTNANDTVNTDAIVIGTSSYLTYICALKTKYYENTIALLPYGEHFNTLPGELLKATEMIIVYFDSDNKTFKNQLPSLCKLVSSNDINLGILLTNKLFDDANLGLTYAGVKENCKFQFDLIELSNDEDSNYIGGYKEVVEAFKNNVWSNVKVPGGNADSLDDNMDEQLENFESLITSIQDFKRISTTMEREEVLNEAEKLAELFIKMLNEN